MDQISFVFTILFMLLGPIKLIPSFAGVTRGTDVRFKRSVASLGTLIAAALCIAVALLGGTFLAKYRISLNAVRIGGGLVLLIAALQVTFQKVQAFKPSSGTPTPMQLAATPVAVPNIVPPAGVAAILLFMMHTSQYPGLAQAVFICLAAVLLMDFLVMYFVDWVLKTPGLTLGLSVFGSALVFVQVCLAIQMLLVAFGELQVIDS